MKLYRVFADEHEEVSELVAGEIGMLIGLKETKTGDTLMLHTCKSTPQSTVSRVFLQSIYLPPPVIYASIEPFSNADDAKLEEALEVIQKEDPSFSYRVDGDTGQTLISGMGQLHLEIISDRLRSDFNVSCQMGKVWISYRETVKSSVGCLQILSYSVDKLLFGRRMQASIKLQIEKTASTYRANGVADDGQHEVGGHDSTAVLLENGNEIVFVSMDGGDSKGLETSRDSFKKNSHVSMWTDAKMAVVSATTTALKRGPLLGLPMHGIRVTVDNLDWSLSTQESLKIAVSEAISQCLSQSLPSPSSAPVAHDTSNSHSLAEEPRFTLSETLEKTSCCTLLEPTMDVVVNVLARYFGPTLSDLSRRGIVVSTRLIDTNGLTEDDAAMLRRQKIFATVPLSSMLDYAADLRALTHGHGFFTMNFRGYGSMTPDRMVEVMKSMRGY